MSQYESFHIGWGEGRFCYDDEKVNRSKELIKEAEKTLDNTKEKLAKGFSSLLAVRNLERSPALADNIRTNESSIEQFPEECVSYMEELYKMVNSKQEEIEQYKNGKWYKKVGATWAMTNTKVLEGIASVGENIVDAGATLLGGVGGIFSSDFRNSCKEFIEKDHAGEDFHKLNERLGINKYSAMYENGTAAKLFKGAGVAIGYVGAAVATGGVLGVTGTTANTIVATVGGLGSGMESGLQQGKEWNSAFGGAVKQAAIQGAAAYAMGKFSEKVQTNRALKATEGTSNQSTVKQAAETVKNSKKAVADARYKYALKNSAENKQILKEAKSALKTARVNQQTIEKQAIKGTLGKYVPENKAESLLKNASESVENGEKVLARAKYEYTMNSTSENKQLLKTAKAALKSARANQQYVENQVLEGVAGQPVSNLSNANGTEAILSKAGKSIVGKAEKIPVMKHLGNGLEKARSLTMAGGTQAEKLTNALIDNPVGNALASKAGTLIDKAAPISNAISKVPGSAVVTKVATEVLKSPGISMSISNEMNKMDGNVKAEVTRAQEKIDKAAEQTIGKDDISYNGILNSGEYNDSGIGTAETSTYNPTTPSTTGNNYLSRNSGNNTYQPNTTARQSGGGYTATSKSSGGGYTTTSKSSDGGYTGSSGSSYNTPTYRATSNQTPTLDNVTPMKNLSPTGGESSPTNNLNNNIPSNSNKTDLSTQFTREDLKEHPLIGPESDEIKKLLEEAQNSNNSPIPNTNTNTNSEPSQSTTSFSSSGTTHSGGGYSSSGYSYSGSDISSYSDEATSIDPAALITEDTSSSTTSGTLASSITSTNRFSNQTIKIPTSSETTSSSNSNMAIPTAAALSAAAAAGIGTKAVIDKKEREKETAEEFGNSEENKEINFENWEGTEDDIKVDYGTEEEDSLDDDNTYSADSIIEKYEATNNSELEEA